MNELIKKFTVGLVGLAMMVTMVPIVPSVSAAEPTTAELLATIASLNRTIEQLNATIAELRGERPQVPAPAVTIEGVPAGFTFVRNLGMRARGEDVRNLQRVLNANPATRIAETGAGSPGNETTVFGPRTRAAVIKFQQEHDIRATGFVGPLTRAKLNEVLVGRVVVTPPVAEVPAGEPRAVLSTVTSPAAGLPLGAQMVPVLTVDIRAGAEALTISEMRFRRVGALGAVADWPSLYLFEGDVRITDFGRTLSADTHIVEFPALGITIPAGQTRSYTLRADVVPTVTTGVGTGNASAFELVGATSNVAIAGLETPIRGNLMSIGGVAVSPVTVARRAVANLRPMIGSQDVEIASFNIAAGANAVRLNQVLVEVTGRGTVTNLELFRDATLLATTSAVGANNRAVFIIPTGSVIERERSQTFVVRADVSGRVNDRIETRIATAEDILVVDEIMGVGVPVTGAPTTPTEVIELQGGRLTLADLGPSAADISTNARDITLTKVGMTADRNLEVRGITVDLTNHAAVRDLRIKDATTRATLMGPIAVPSATNPITGAITLTAGVTRNIIVTVDTVTTTVPVTANVTVPFGNVRDVATGDLLRTGDVVPATISGDAQRIVAPGLTAALMGHPISATVVTGVANAPAVGVTLSAVGTDVTVRRIDARVFVNTAATFATGTEVTDPNRAVILARLMDGTTVLSSRTLMNTPDAVGHDFGLVRFDGLNLSVVRGTPRNLVVQISTASGLTPAHFMAVSIPGADIDATDPDGRTVTVSGVVNLLAPGTAPARVITVNPVGTLAAAIATGVTPAATIIPVGNVAVGPTDVPVTIVRYTATYEPIILQDIVVSRAGTAADTAFRSVEILDGTRVISGLFPAGATTTTFTDVNIEIPVGQRDLTFRVDLAGVGHGATSGHVFELDAQVTRARGRDSGSPVTTGLINIAGGNPLTVRQTVPTLARLTNDTALAGAAGDEVLRFTVAANAAGDVTLRSVTIRTEITTVATATARLIEIFDGATRIGHGTTAATNIATTTITITPELVIPAGAAPRTLVVRLSTAGLTAAADRVTAFIEIDGAPGTTGSFIWRDGGIVDINGNLVPGLLIPITGDTLRI